MTDDNVEFVIDDEDLARAVKDIELPAEINLTQMARFIIETYQEIGDADVDAIATILMQILLHEPDDKKIRLLIGKLAMSETDVVAKVVPF